ncbi:MAG: dockerin type I domain-containing protein [Clostridiales bacterium]|jgi:hypothetical protein|nr:dockerin type I domain-containing protein [Clostridiales bacterium]
MSSFKKAFGRAALRLAAALPFMLQALPLAPFTHAVKAAELTYAEVFPDVNFRQAVLEITGEDKTDESPFTDSDKEITASQIKLDVSEMNIADLTGIEYFTGLETLYCSGNQLTALDISANISLQNLYCYNNSIVSPDDVIGWRERGLALNGPESPWISGGSFIFYPQNLKLEDSDLDNIDKGAIVAGSVMAKPGGFADVPVFMENNPGIAGFTLELWFDNTKLTPVSLTPEPWVQTINSNLNEPDADLSNLAFITAHWANISNITDNGVLYTVRFQVKEGLPGGDIPLTLTCAPSSIANDKHEPISLALISGVAAIKNKMVLYGDIYSDGEVNLKDGIKLTQYLAGWTSVVLTEDEREAADVKHDGVINTIDAIKLQQYLAEWSDIVLGPAFSFLL